MRVQEVMSAPVISVRPDDAASAAWNRMQAHSVRHLVVFDDDHALAGVVSAGDLGGRYGATLRESRFVSDVMSRHVVSVEPSATVREAANLMRGNLVECLPVVDAGKVVGIVTSLDLLVLLGHGTEKPVATARRPGRLDKPKRAAKKPPARDIRTSAVGALTARRRG